MCNGAVHQINADAAGRMLARLACQEAQRKEIRVSDLPRMLVILCERHKPEFSECEQRKMEQIVVRAVIFLEDM